MSKPMLVSAADLQMSYSTYASVPAMWGDSFFATTQLVDLAIAHAAPLLLAGDVLEKAYPDSYTMRVLLRELSRAADSGVDVLFIQGNHELVRRAPWVSLAEKAKYMHEQLLWLGDGAHALYGIDYQPAGAIAQAMAKVPSEATVLVSHQAWSELMGSRGDATLAEVVPSHIKMVISGDFHGHRTMTLKNRDGGTFVLVSPGSTTLRQIGEDPAKHCYLVYDNLTLTSLPILGRQVIYTRVETEDRVVPETDRGLAAIVDNNSALPPNIRLPMWIVQVRAGVDVSHLQRAAANRAHVFVRPFGDESEEEDCVSSGGSFEEVARREIPDGPELYDALRLWRASDVQAEAEAIVAERMAELGW